VPRDIDFSKLRAVAHTQAAVLAKHSKPIDAVEQKIQALEEEIQLATQKIHELSDGLSHYGGPDYQYKEALYAAESKFNDVISQSPELQPGETICAREKDDLLACLEKVLQKPHVLQCEAEESALSFCSTPGNR